MNGTDNDSEVRIQVRQRRGIPGGWEWRVLDGDNNEMVRGWEQTKCEARTTARVAAALINDPPSTDVLAGWEVTW